ncbi:MAG: RsmD family RNA methyltransferase [archaeon]|nr:RsmD family RNA methyltransferase [archaeon]
MNKTYLFELLGELKDMPRDEVIKTCETESAGNCRMICDGPGYVVMEIPEECLDGVNDRLALTHMVGDYLGSFEPEDLSSVENMILPEGTFAIRYRRFEGLLPDVDSQKLIRRIGAILSKNNDVDLKNPDVVVHMLISDRIHLHIERKVFNADLLRERKVSERPFFSPISLHPKYARALINLTGVKRGGTVLDPFCGTGGIVIEAANMGMRAIASDFDKEMVAGTRENMAYYNLPLHDFETIDISEIPERFTEIDAIACDPPYGRSTKTGGENVLSIYNRALEAFPKVLTAEGKAGVVLPLLYETEHMVRDDVYKQHVHGTLSRHYHIFGQK